MAEARTEVSTGVADGVGAGVGDAGERRGVAVGLGWMVVLGRVVGVGVADGRPAV